MGFLVAVAFSASPFNKPTACWISARISPEKAVPWCKWHEGHVSLGKQIVCQQLPQKNLHTTHDGSQAMNESWNPRSLNKIPGLQARQLLVCKALSHPFEDSRTSCAVSSLEGQGALFVEFWDYYLPWLHHRQDAGPRKRWFGLGPNKCRISNVQWT